MRIYLGSDHRGFKLKEQVKEWLLQERYEVEEAGNYEFDPDDDYVEYAIKVAEMVEGSESHDRGILLCGSGHGMEMVANRFPHVRAILGFNDQVVQQGREHEDANILVLAADWVSEGQAQERVRLFLTTEVNEAGRYAKRREQMANLEVRK